MPTPKTADCLTELLLAVREERVTIPDAVQSLRDAVEVLEHAAFQAGHNEGEKYAAEKTPKTSIYIP